MNDLEMPAIDAETHEQWSARKKCEAIDKKLEEIDVKSVRSLRAKLAGTDTEHDRQKLADLEAEAEVLRQERTGLQELSARVEELEASK